MKDVDLLTEIRQWRDEFARSHGYDLAAIAAAVREADRGVASRLVRGEPRRPAAAHELKPAGQRPRPASAAAGT